MAVPLRATNGRSRVSLVKGDDRYRNIGRALSLIDDDLCLDGINQILVKPNFTTVAKEIAVTHVDAMKALLDFIRERTNAQIVIAEGAGTEGDETMMGFRRFGYLDLRQRYDLSFIDLNRSEAVEAEILDRNLQPLTVRISRAVVEADYRISICPPKTHDFVVMTASLKNLVMGSLLRKEGKIVQGLVVLAKRLVPRRLVHGALPHAIGSSMLASGGNDKIKMHQGYPVMNINLARIAKIVSPDLAVIDGFQGMEGEGPVDGRPVDMRVAIASTDFLAADALAARLMGFDINSIGYLHYCQELGLGQGRLDHVEVIGENIDSCVRCFEPHPTYQDQLQWQMDNAMKYLI